jgi:hypothetical protein
LGIPPDFFYVFICGPVVDDNDAGTLQQAFSVRLDTPDGKVREVIIQDKDRNSPGRPER